MGITPRPRGDCVLGLSSTNLLRTQGLIASQALERNTIVVVRYVCFACYHSTVQDPNPPLSLKI